MHKIGNISIHQCYRSRLYGVELELYCVGSFEEHFEGKGISSFTISQNGNEISRVQSLLFIIIYNVNIQKKYSKKKVSISILTFSNNDIISDQSIRSAKQNHVYDRILTEKFIY
ncbi:membrane metallo-endopeptidase-like 1 [Aphis craccivora]|uniref:Membrane metallo-endopeptidase-like 1 n=1 Tax=Aphis craccivora TaxID=307492 RepID=A0A6G0ZBY0_APHCR|nr:membrane metallo-endopeptidase-like 1 [Aphis craccivora]